MRIALLGAGGHGTDHLLAAQSLGHVLTHVADTSDRSIDKMLEKLDRERDELRVLRGARTLAHAAARYDGVLVCTPDHFHAGNLHSLVQNMPVGYTPPILLEKPGAIDLATLRRFQNGLRMAQEKGIAVTTCYLRRCDPPYIWLKKHIGELIEMYGQLKKIELTFDYPIPDDPWKLEGRSLLLDHAVHELDYLLWLLGSGTLTARREEDSPLEYKMEGTYGDVEFFFHGKRLSERVPTPEFPRGEYIEVITLHLDGDYVCELNAHTGAFKVTKNNRVLIEHGVGKTNYDLRLQGVMSSFAELANGTGMPLVSPDEFRWSTEAAVRLVQAGRFESSPNV